VSKKTLYRLPGFGNRVVLAAGEDAHIGSHKLDTLLDRIAKDEAPALTRQETASLRAVPFKRQRGQHKTNSRFEQSVYAHDLLMWLKQIRQVLKSHPAEKAEKRRQRGHYDLRCRVAEEAHKLLQQDKLAQKQDEDFVDYPVSSVASLMNRLKRN
jgi:hypothetical protein